MNTIDFLAGRKILAEADSPINGKVTVVRELAWGMYISAGNLPQSGGLAKTIWEKSLRAVKRQKREVKTILILGFAGGGIAHIVRGLWPETNIYGVDIDPIMVDFGRKYLKWEETGAVVWIQDAQGFINELLKEKKPSGKFVSKPTAKRQLPTAKFDLVCVDMYVGAGVPEKFNSAEFAMKVKKLLAKDGIAVFNRLHGGGDREKANEFKRKLDTVFPHIDTVYPEANVMFLCKD